MKARNNKKRGTVTTITTGISKNTSTGKYYVRAISRYLGTYSSLADAKRARKLCIHYGYKVAI